MEENKKLTIKEALVLIQEIRHYDKQGDMVFHMDEYEEMRYLERVLKNYSGTDKENLRKLKIASKLEGLGLININNSNRESEYPDPSKLSPLVRIKRKNNYKK